MHASNGRLRKLDGDIYRPIEGCPCAYKVGESMKEFLNEILRGDANYECNAKVHGLLMGFLEDHDPDGLRNLKMDERLLSFTNGLLLLPSKGVGPVEPVFLPLDNEEAKLMAAEGRIARHHIPLEFKPDAPTPNFDGLLSSQMSREVADSLEVLLGRLLFKVGTHDNWQVNLFLYGVGGSGKSVVIETVCRFYAPSQVGNITANQEQIFGLDGKYQKHLVVGRDMPKNMSKILSQEILQQMISGEQVSVPRKTLLAKDVVWTAPTMFASNHIPDYADNQGQISRRFAFYHFRNFVRKPDPMLMTRIEAEIPALIGRFVKKYLAAAREHASKSFWDWCPKEVLKIQQELKSNMSYVGRFLALDKDHEDAIIGPEYDQKLVYTERSDHLSTPVMTLQKAFKEWMTKAHKNAQTDEKINKEMMERFRWEVCDKNVCRHCDRHSSSGHCCDKYTREERTKKLVVVGLNLFHSSYVPAPPLTNPIDAIN